MTDNTVPISPVIPVQYGRVRLRTNLMASHGLGHLFCMVRKRTLPLTHPTYRKHGVWSKLPDSVCFFTSP